VAGAGVVAGLMTVVVVLSLTSLVFSGPLASSLPVASVLVLGVAAVMNVILSRASSGPGSVMVPQDVTAAILATALGAAVVGLATDEALSTALVIIGFSSALTAVVMLVLGWFHLGSLIRYIPYPVIGGFLAGTGVLLLIGAAQLMTADFTWQRETVGTLVVGTALGALLLALAVRNIHPLVLPGAIAGSVVVFYTVLAAAGMSISDARDLGFLATSRGGIGLPSFDLGPVHWSAVGGSLAAIVTVPIVAVVALLLNVAGLELVSGRDVDLDQELRAAGWANLAGVVGGAQAGYHVLSLSALGFRAVWPAGSCPS
jgi:sulfate permease, SulP family